MDTQWAEEALRATEKSGRLDGLEIEHYVGGGLPPPHYRSDQLRLLAKDGRDTFEFATPHYEEKVPEGGTYPLDIYTLPATPEEVKTFARLVRESGAFAAPAPDAGPGHADALKTELIVNVRGREAKRVYAGGEPAELARLREVVDPLIARLQKIGAHRVKR